jgi:MFS family permease
MLGVSLSIFTAASVACALATSIAQLIAFRVVTKTNSRADGALLKVLEEEAKSDADQYRGFCGRSDSKISAPALCRNLSFSVASAAFEISSRIKISLSV